MKSILLAGLIVILPLAGQDAAQSDHLAREARYDALARVGIVPAASGVTINAGVVKNAPYSAEATTTSTQVLSDGNRIEQSTTQKLYRDSQGRERREETLLAVGAVTQPDAQLTISISDPMERVSYTLTPQTRTARRNPGAGLAPTYLYQGANRTFSFYTTVPAQADTTRAKEDLGTQTIEGVMAQGTRTTETIPAGQIGNLLPINIVDEVWYSPELKMNLLTTHTDPRSGQVIYKLTNINRSEPPRSLFEPPADYTVTGPGTGGRGWTR